MKKYERVLILTMYYMLIGRPDLAKTLWSWPTDVFMPTHVWQGKSDRYSSEYEQAVQMRRLSNAKR